MKIIIAPSISAMTEKAWKKLTKKAQKEYIKKKPNSKWAAKLKKSPKKKAVKSTTKTVRKPITKVKSSAKSNKDSKSINILKKKMLDVEKKLQEITGDEDASPYDWFMSRGPEGKLASDYQDLEDKIKDLELADKKKTFKETPETKKIQRYIKDSFHDLDRPNTDGGKAKWYKSGKRYVIDANSGHVEVVIGPITMKKYNFKEEDVVKLLNGHPNMVQIKRPVRKRYNNYSLYD